MLTLLAIVYACGLLTILLVAHLKGQQINFAHIMLSFLLPGMVFIFISNALNLEAISKSCIVTKIPYEYSDNHYIRYDYDEDKYFILAEDLFDISRAKYRVYLDSDAVDTYIEHVNDFTRYIEESVKNDH